MLSTTEVAGEQEGLDVVGVEVDPEFEALIVADLRGLQFETDVDGLQRFYLTLQ